MTDVGIVIKEGKVLISDGKVATATAANSCGCCDVPESDVFDIVQDGSHIWICGDIGTPADTNIQQGKRLKSDGSSVWTNLVSPRALGLSLGVSGDTYFADRQIAGKIRKYNTSGTLQWTTSASGFFPLRAAVDTTQSPKVLTFCNTSSAFSANSYVSVNDASGAFLATGNRIKIANDVQVDSTGWYFAGHDSSSTFDVVKAALGANGPTGAATWGVNLGSTVKIIRCVLGTSALFCFGTEEVVADPTNKYLKLWALNKSTGAVLATFVPHTTSGAGSNVVANSLDVIGDTVYIAGSTQPKRNPDIAPFEDLTCFWKLAYAASAFAAPSITMTIDQLYDGAWFTDGQAREFRAIDCMAVDGTDLFFGMGGNTRVGNLGPNLWSFIESTEVLNWDLL